MLYRLMCARPFSCDKRRVRARCQGLSAVLVLAALWLGTRDAASQGLQGTFDKLPAQQGCEGNATSLDISASRMTFDSKTRTFLFEDKVRIVRCAMVIVCDRLQVVNGANEQNIERIIATGNVRFEQGTRAGIAERADYFEAEQKLVLTGNPRIWDTQEHNELAGEEIIVMLQSEKVFVKQARVLFHPRKTPIKAP